MQPRVAGTINQITCQERFFSLSPSSLRPYLPPSSIFNFAAFGDLILWTPADGRLRRGEGGGGRAQGVETTVRTAGGTMCGYRGYKVVVLAPQNSKVNSCGELLSDASLLYKDDAGFLGGPRKCTHTL